MAFIYFNPHEYYSRSILQQANSTLNNMSNIFFILEQPELQSMLNATTFSQQQFTFMTVDNNDDL